MATFNLSIPGSICCYENGGTMIEPGGIIRLTLNSVKYPNLVSNPIDAAVNSISEAEVWDSELGKKVAGHIYNVTVDDSDMPVVNGAVLLELDYCDLVNWACKACCDEINDYLEDCKTEIQVVTNVEIVNDSEDPTCLRLKVTKHVIEFCGTIGLKTVEELEQCVEIDPYANVPEGDFNNDVEFPAV
jgi:hypothetical protein